MTTDFSLAYMISDSRRACVDCFNDQNLRDLIEDEGEIGECDWCGSTNVKSIPIYDLSEMFREVANCYDEVTGPKAYLNGELISVCLQEDWNIFSLKIDKDPDLIQEMTLSILYADTRPKERIDFPDYDGFFKIELPELEFEWFEMLEKMLADRESQIDENLNDDFLSFPNRIEYAIEDNAHSVGAGRIYYRARIHKDRKRKIRFSTAEMGAPSRGEATPGRANREKEPVLYLSSDEPTALSEVRAWKGMAIALAKVRLKKDVRLLDLTTFTFPKSPFETEHLCYNLQLTGLFQSFGSALLQPLLPGEEEKHYLPSQKLCDLIRQNKVDGLIYPSAMGPGNNIVLFNPDDGQPLEVRYVRVDTPVYPNTEIDEHDDLYEEWPYEHLIGDVDIKDSL